MAPEFYTQYTCHREQVDEITFSWKYQCSLLLMRNSSVERQVREAVDKYMWRCSSINQKTEGYVWFTRISRQMGKLAVDISESGIISIKCS